MTGRTIERITTADLTGLADKSSEAHPGLEAVRREFFTDLSPKEFHRRYLELLAVDSQSVRHAPDLNPRGAEAYWIREGANLIAVTILHFYTWQALAPQICFQVDRNGDAIASIRLVRFEMLVNLDPPPCLAAELATIWVAPESRGQGIGKLLFEHGLHLFDTFLGDRDYTFTAVRGNLGKEKSRELFQYLLANEEMVNGRSPDAGEVLITGISVPIVELESALGLDYRYFPIHPDSIPIAILATRANMRFIGYFKSANAIYARVWQ